MPIRQLPAYIANQIAAGEVVERPASIVKELVENSLDAGATQIDVWCEAGGRQLIRVRDNGSGIPKEELALALSPHATSKLTTIEDLFSITSLGFRGEALASIASVSEMSLISRHKEAPEAWGIHGSADCEPLPASHPIGTTVEIHDLFFNTPARRKFLKSDKTEWLKIQEIMMRLALSHPAVGFSLFHQGQKVWDLPPQAHLPAKRVSALYGAAFLEHARYVEGSISDLSFWGWLGHPEMARPTADKQAFFVNGRFVRDKILSHAVSAYCQSLLRPGTYPAYVLFLSLPHEQVDVNVHPTKHEIRFAEPQRIHEFITCQLSSSIFIDLQKNEFLQYSDLNQPSFSAKKIEEKKTNKVISTNPFSSCVVHPSSFENTDSTPVSSPSPATSPWCFFMEQDPFLLGSYEGKPFVIHARKLFIHMKMNTSLSFSSKLLLMPQRHAVKKEWAGIEFLKQNGWQIDWIAEDQVLIRATPFYIPMKEINTVLNQLMRITDSSTTNWYTPYSEQIPLAQLAELFLHGQGKVLEFNKDQVIWLTSKILERLV